MPRQSIQEYADFYHRQYRGPQGDDKPEELPRQYEWGYVTRFWQNSGGVWGFIQNDDQLWEVGYLHTRSFSIPTARRAW